MKANNRHGFTLIEVIIAVALVAIMAVAITPPLVQNIKNGKMTRAQSDANTIATAIQTLYKDIGNWPTESDEVGNRVARLVGNDALGGANTGIGAGKSGVSGSYNWRGYSRVVTLSSVLITNRTASRNPLYTASQNPSAAPGWNGPYLSRVPLDPWGNPYVVNMYYVDDAITNNDLHNVIVLSGGANGVFETTFSSSIYNEQVSGDDVGAVIKGATRFLDN